MSRKARLLVPNCLHHIVQRGHHDRNTVFVADDDYQFYLENLFEWKVRLGIKKYAWCLMTNHVHLIVEPGDNAKTLSGNEPDMSRHGGRAEAISLCRERYTEYVKTVISDKEVKLLREALQRNWLTGNERFAENAQK